MCFQSFHHNSGVQGGNCSQKEGTTFVKAQGHETAWVFGWGTEWEQLCVERGHRGKLGGADQGPQQVTRAEEFGVILGTSGHHGRSQNRSRSKIGLHFGVRW